MTNSLAWDNRGYSQSLFLECAADGGCESHFKSHTEPILIADKELQNNSLLLY